LRVNQELTDPTRRILVYCEFASLDAGDGDAASDGFRCAVALDGGMKAWREASYAVKAGKEP